MLFHDTRNKRVVKNENTRDFCRWKIGTAYLPAVVPFPLMAGNAELH